MISGFEEDASDSLETLEVIIDAGIVLLSIISLECAAELVDSSRAEEMMAEELRVMGPGVISGIELEEREEIEDVLIADDDWTCAVLGSSDVAAGVDGLAGFVSLDSGDMLDLVAERDSGDEAGVGSRALGVEVKVGLFVPLERELVRREVDERPDVWIPLLLDKELICDTLFCEEVSSEMGFVVDCERVLVGSGTWEDGSRLGVEAPGVMVGLLMEVTFVKERDERLDRDVGVEE